MFSLHLREIMKLLHVFRGFFRGMVDKKIAAVAICFPAISNLTQCRIRICLSAKHTRQMLDEVSLKRRKPLYTTGNHTKGQHNTGVM